MSPDAEDLVFSRMKLGYYRELEGTVKTLRKLVDVLSDLWWEQQRQRYLNTEAVTKEEANRRELIIHSLGRHSTIAEEALKHLERLVQG